MIVIFEEQPEACKLGAMLGCVTEGARLQVDMARALGVEIVVADATGLAWLETHVCALRGNGGNAGGGEGSSEEGGEQ